MSDYVDTEYVDVASRRAQFRARYPFGSLAPADLAEPYRIEHMPDGSTFIAYVAAAYRYPGDPNPGVGIGWEPFPGKSDFTRDSELQNAETSAWGRAIAAALAADTHRIATVEDIERRRADREATRPAPVEPPPVPVEKPSSADWRKLKAAGKRLAFDESDLPYLAGLYLKKPYDEVSRSLLADFRTWLVANPDAGRQLLAENPRELVTEEPPGSVVADTGPNEGAAT